jgi:hypothetical protein
MVSDPRNEVDIKNVDMSNEIKADMSGDVDFKLKWFPALFQGTAEDSRDNIGLYVKPK